MRGCAGLAAPLRCRLASAGRCCAADENGERNARDSLCEVGGTRKEFGSSCLPCLRMDVASTGAERRWRGRAASEGRGGPSGTEGRLPAPPRRRCQDGDREVQVVGTACTARQHDVKGEIGRKSGPYRHASGRTCTAGDRRGCPHQMRPLLRHAGRKGADDGRHAARRRFIPRYGGRDGTPPAPVRCAVAVARSAAASAPRATEAAWLPRSRALWKAAALQRRRSPQDNFRRCTCAAQLRKKLSRCTFPLAAAPSALARPRHSSRATKDSAAMDLSAENEVRCSAAVSLSVSLCVFCEATKKFFFSLFPLPFFILSFFPLLSLSSPPHRSALHRTAALCAAAVTALKPCRGCSACTSAVSFLSPTHFSISPRSFPAGSPSRPLRPSPLRRPRPLPRTTSRCTPRETSWPWCVSARSTRRGARRPFFFPAHRFALCFPLLFLSLHSACVSCAGGAAEEDCGAVQRDRLQPLGRH